jgi:AraC family transcriptional regulator
MIKEVLGIDEICRATQYLEASLCEHITVADMAHCSGYSLFHFSRLFNSLTGHSPYDYLIRRRLSEAAICLRNKEGSITDLAFQYQFGSLEAFSRSFKKMFGVSPVRYRESAAAFNPLRTALTTEYLLHINENAFFVPQMVALGELSLAINIIDHSAPGNLSLVYFNPAEHPMHFRQVFCSDAKDYRLVHEHQALKVIPPQNYAMFSHRAGKLELTYQYILQTWMPLAGYALCKSYLLTKSNANLIGKKANQVELYLPLD